MRAAAALVAIFVAAGGSCSDKQEKERPVLALVNDAPIYLESFRREFQRLRLDDEEGSGAPPVLSEQIHKRTLLDNLIERRLMLQEAERLNVVVGTDEVENNYKRLRAGWDETEIDELLQHKDMTPAELKRELREQIMIRKFFRDHIFSRVAVTDEEIMSYIEAHPEVRLKPEEVRALQIVVKTEERAREIADEIKHGLAFEDAAIKYSLSPEAKSGGDLGFFTRGSMPRVIEETCLALKPGEVSNVVGSDYGFHLFKVLERRGDSLRPIDQVREQVEQQLRRDKEQAAQRARVEELRSAAKIVIDEKVLASVH